MRFLRGLTAVLALLLCLGAQEVTRDRVERVLSESQCQRDLPGVDDVAVGEGGATAESDANRSRSTSPRPWSSSLATGQIAQIGLWLVVGLVVIWLLASIFGGRSRAPAPPPPAPRATPVAASPLVTGHAADAVGDPDGLAARGLFAAAVHGLLQRAFATWAARGDDLPQHATGRELLRLAGERSLPVDALGALVVAAERVHFGGRPADRELFDASRARLVQWEAACRGER